MADGVVSDTHPYADSEAASEMVHGDGDGVVPREPARRVGSPIPSEGTVASVKKLTKWRAVF